MVSYLLVYLTGSALITFLLTCTFALSKPLPDRRKSDRRNITRAGHVDRRASYRQQASAINNADDALSVA